MRPNARLGVVVAFLLASAALTPAAEPQDDAFRSSADLVRIFTTVQNRNAEFLTNLGAGDFEVLDNGSRVPIQLFSNSPAPLRIALMLDTTGIGGHIEYVRAAALRLLDSLTSQDMVLVGTFGDEVSFGGQFSHDSSRARRTLETELWSPGLSKLWAALARAMQRFPNDGGRRVIIVLSDGIDMCAVRLLGDACASESIVRTLAQQDEVMIYAVRLAGTYRDYLYTRMCIPEEACTKGAPGVRRMPVDNTLLDLAKDTGGGGARIEADELATRFEAVIEELRNQYVLGISPTAPYGAPHRLEVRSRRSGVQVRARTSYIARDTK